uniref:Uncharacterized protein n=1 Tax=Clostera anachoreta granulovirus TaxID=283675 RepID=Q0VHB4_9BBAC|nr:unknown [Clostera anachoreta granulovirus]
MKFFSVVFSEKAFTLVALGPVHTRDQSLCHPNHFVEHLLRFPGYKFCTYIVRRARHV